MSKHLICSSCGHVGSSHTAVKGNILIEIVLWLCFIVPGLIYSLWRSSSRHKTCPVCGSTNMIPVDTPVGQKLLANQGKTVQQVLAEKPCQTCGRVMSLDYVYPTKNTVQKMNRVLPEEAQIKYEDFLTIYEIVPLLVKRIGANAYDVLISIFPTLVSPPFRFL